MGKWLDGWTNRKEIQIKADQVDSTLTDFPLYVKIYDDDELGKHILSDGADLRFTSNDEQTTLPYEREDFSVGQGWKFNGINQHVRMEYSSDYSSTMNFPDGDWTVGGWVKLDSNAINSPQYLFSWNNFSQTPSFSWLFYQTVAYPNQLGFALYDDNGTSTGEVVSSSSPGARTDWMHILLQRSSNTFTQYIDGIAEGAFTSTAFGAISYAGDINFGRRSDGASVLYLDGHMAQWAKWDRALSTGEITQLVSGINPRHLNPSWHLPMYDYKQRVEGLSDYSQLVLNTAKAKKDYASVVLNRSPIGYWRLDETSGLTAVDLGSGGNDGTYVNSPTLNQAGALLEDDNAAVHFDGLSQHATMPISLSHTSVVAVSWWMSWDSYTGSHKTVFEFTPNFNGSPYGFGVYYDIVQTSLAVVIHGNIGYNYGLYDEPSVGEWHHYFAVFDKTKTSDEVDLYIDGVLQVPVIRPLNVNNTNSFSDDTLYIATRGGTESFGDFNLDEVAIFDYALTEDTIRDLYLAGRGTGPVGYWRLGESSGTTAADSSGNNHDGTYINSPTLNQPGALLADDNASVLFTEASTHYITVGDVAALELDWPVSITAWIYINTLPSNVNEICSKWDDTGGGSEREFFFDVDATTDGKLRYGKSRTGTSTEDHVHSNTTVAVGQWVHVGVTVVANGDWVMYQDGEEDGSGTFGNLQQYHGTADFQIGAVELASGNRFAWDGLLDEVTIWNESLTATEIQKLYLAGRQQIEITNQDSTLEQSPELPAQVANGDLWIKVPSISSTASTVIYMYYGNSEASDGEDAVTLWSDYERVYHLNESSGDAIDSTGNQDATYFGNLPTPVAGVIVNSQSLTPTGDYANPLYGTGIDPSTQSLTMSCWAIADAINKITMGQNDATNKRCYFGNNPNGKWGIGIYTSQWTQNSVAADTTVLGQWYYLTLTMNSSINTSNFYIDGGKEVLQKAYSSYEIPSNLMIGRLGLNSSFDWDGLIDEVRYSAVAKSAEWIKFEYYNMYSSDQELIISSETGGTGKFGKK